MFCLTPLALLLQIAKVPQIHADLLLVFKMLPPGRIGLVPLLLACQHAEAQFLLEVALGLLVAGLEQGPLDVLDEREPGLLEPKGVKAPQLLLCELARVGAQ